MAGSKVTGTASAGLGTAGGWQKGQVATASRLAWGRSGAGRRPRAQGRREEDSSAWAEQLLREQPRPGRSACLGGSNKVLSETCQSVSGPLPGLGCDACCPLARRRHIPLKW